MSRVFKFRSWSITGKCWLTERNVSNVNAVPVVNNRDGFSLDAQFVIYEQSTGLRDHNGKEIFEGDVVRGYWKDSLQPQVVIYQAPSFVLKTNKRNKMWSTFDLAPSELQLQIVIGNIHENPELLKPTAKQSKSESAAGKG